MKRLFLYSILCILTSLTTFADTITSVTGGGLWRNASTWDKGHVPQSSDVVIITSEVEVSNAGYAICKEVIIGNSDGSGEGKLSIVRGQSLSVLEGISVNVADGLDNYGEIWGADNAILTVQNNGSIFNHSGASIMNYDLNFLPSQGNGRSRLEGRIYGNISINSDNVWVVNQLILEGNIEVVDGFLGSHEGTGRFDVAVYGDITLSETAQIPADGRMVCDGTLSDSRAVKQGEVKEIDAFHPVVGGYWNLLGLPNHTDLSPLAADDAPDMWALPFDYTTHTWSENFLHANSNLNRGEAIILWSDEDYIMHLEGTDNESDVVVTKNITANSEGERWIALSNPYSKPISIAQLMNSWNNDHEVLLSPWGLSANNIQGHAIYLYEQGFWEPFIFDPDHALSGSAFLAELESHYRIEPGVGFMINLMEDREYKLRFTQENWQSLETPTTKARREAIEPKFIDLALISRGPQVSLKFAQNDNAEDGFDVSDAIKMFGNENIAEPYFVVEGKAVSAQNVKSSEYNAEMNIRSSYSGEVILVARSIPEGYSVRLLDGANEIRLQEGELLPLEIEVGENAERFRLLVTKSCVSINQARTLPELTIRNHSRTINIEGGKAHSEVFNSLGQKVFESNSNSFSLEGIEAGAYIIRATCKESGVSKSSKIILL